jgi:hypothetical protein
MQFLNTNIQGDACVLPRSCYRCLFVLGGFLAVVPLQLGAPIRHLVSRTVAHTAARKDWRLEKLDRFFESCQCPVRRYAPVFLRVADRHQIDWRLLPSLSFVESTGGKAARGHNVFGWENGARKFQSVEHAIETVGERLGNSSYYRGKSITDLLRTYNPVDGYVDRVSGVMARISAI